METSLEHLTLVCLRGKSDEIWVYDFVSAFLLRFNIFISKVYSLESRKIKN